MNLTIAENKLRGSGLRPSRPTGAGFAALTFIIITAVNALAEIPLKTFTFSTPAATDRNLTADFSLPEIDSISAVKIAELPDNAVAFTPVNQLNDYRCAILALLDQTLRSEKQLVINRSLPSLKLKSSPQNSENFRIGLATVSQGQLKVLFPPSAQTINPAALKLDRASRLSYTNIEQAIQELSGLQADRKRVVIYTSGDLDNRSGKQAELVRTALAAQVQICVVAVDSRARAKSRTILGELASQTGGMYFKINRQNADESDDRLLKCLTSGGRIRVDLGQLTLPATLHFQVLTVSGKVYGFAHQINAIVSATASTPEASSDVTPVSPASHTPIPNPVLETSSTHPERTTPQVSLLLDSRPKASGENPSGTKNLTSSPTILPQSLMQQATDRHAKPPHPSRKRLARYITVGAVIAGIMCLLALLMWLAIRAVKRRFERLDNKITELKPVLAGRVDINAELAAELVQMKGHLTDVHQQLAMAEEQLAAQTSNLDDAKRTMVVLVNGLWDVRRFLVLPGETKPREAFNGESASEMFDTLQYTINILQSDNEFSVVDKTGSAYTPGVVRVVGRRIRKDLTAARVAHTEKPEISWKGEQLASATVSLEIPAEVLSRDLVK
jgi:hypothetical protein